MTGQRFVLRPPAEADLADIAACWRASFGDSEEFIRDFFAAADPLRHAVAAEADGRVRSVMFAFDGLSLGGVRASYLYALCTHPQFRRQGLGGAVVSRLAAECLDEGAELVCLSPADAALERWYCAALGFRPLQRAEDLCVRPAPNRDGRCTILSAAEYAALRHAEIEVTPQLLAAQETLCRHYGGALLRTELDGGEALLCAEPREGGIFVRDLVCPPALAGRALSAAAAHFGVKAVYLRRPGGTGEALLGLSRSGASPACLRSEFFPFLLD